MNGGTCVLIGQYTKDLTNINVFFLYLKKRLGSAWLSSVRVVKREVKS